MSEMHTLKEEAEKQKMIQRHQAVHDYIDDLLKKVDVRMKRAGQVLTQNMYALILMFIMVGIDLFTSDWTITLMSIISILFNWIMAGRTTRYMHKVEVVFAEIDGVFNTLEHLGIIDPHWRNRGRRKKEVSKMEAAWAKAKTVKLWKPWGQPVTNGSV